MPTLFLTHDTFLDHIAAAGHPERPSRLESVIRGARDVEAGDDLVAVEPLPASRTDLERVHSVQQLDTLEALSAAGGGHIDADTGTNSASYEAAVLAAGAGLEAVRHLDAGEGDAAFCAVRPPGHHATPTRSMGFCLLNSAAVTAAVLADRGERVLIVDYDAHHGNGTQDIFYDDPRVAYVSFHEYPLYPGTGRMTETGGAGAEGTTVNLPLPAGATGDVYRHGIDEVVAPLVDWFRPTWVLLSAGFDAHRADPLTGLGLAAGDFADLTRELVAFAPAGRRVLFLEGGYDLDALRFSTAACLGALVGVDHRPEPSTSGGPGHEVVAAVTGLQHEVRSTHEGAPSS